MSALDLKVNIRIPLSYDSVGAKSMSLTGPHLVQVYSFTEVRYKLGIFIENGYPKEDDRPDIEIMVSPSEVMQLKNALSAMLIASNTPA
ncbi:MAG TPA: hypothetical protein PLZ24_16505 [Flavobacteriales bacterium]|nr:hypothetical protein [Flavobacteriales bacterium]